MLDINMKLLRSLTILSIGSAIALNPLASKAITVEEVANPRLANGGWVTDMADILNSDTEQELNRLISAKEKADGTEIAVVTVPETAPAASPKAFANELFNYWGIGKDESNNGILFLVSPGDNRVEIETGYGIPEQLSNSTVKVIIDSTILPQYREGDFDSGTLQGTQALIAALQPQIETTKTEAIFDWQNALLFLLVGTGAIAVIGGVGSLFKKRGKVFVTPNKNLSLQRRDNRTVCCAKCHQPTNRIKKIDLTQAQKVAQKLGGVSYRGYQCSTCVSNNKAYSIVAYFSDSERYDDCPKCQELTVIKTAEVITPATSNRPGLLLSKKQCHCCGYYREEAIEIHKIVRHNSYKHHAHHHNSTSQHHYYGGSSYDGGAGSGGSFGGGASGGDGAGGSW